MAFFEGKWNCAQCRIEGIPGSKDRCPNCGDPRNATLDRSEEEYLPDNAREVTDPEELKIASGGPNWNCGNCGESNLDTASVCGECGDPRNWNDTVNQVLEYVEDDDAAGVSRSDRSQIETDWVDGVLRGADKLQPLADGPVTLPTRTLRMSDLPAEGRSPYGEERPQDVVRPRDDTRRRRTVLKYRPTAPSGLVKIVMIGVIALLVVFGLVKGGGWFYANHIKTQTVELTVRSLWWERSVEVEELRTLTQKDWSIPPGGREIGSSQEVKSYNKVFDHYVEKTRKVPKKVKTGSHQENDKCKMVKKGNGYYGETCTKKTVDDYKIVYEEEKYQEKVYRDEPVYATKYTYQIDRWMTGRSERASGKSDPYWPDPHLRGSRERVGSRFELYRVTLVDAKGRTAEKTAGEATWSRLVEGQKVSGEQTRSGDVRDVHWP